MWIVLSLILLFVIVLVFNAVKVTLKARKLTPQKAIITEKEQIEYANRLGEMIRCKTVSEKDKFNEEEFLKLVPDGIFVTPEHGKWINL